MQSGILNVLENRLSDRAPALFALFAQSMERFGRKIAALSLLRRLKTRGKLG